MFVWCYPKWDINANGQLRLFPAKLTTSADRCDTYRDTTAVDLYYSDYNIVHAYDVAPQRRRMHLAVDGISTPFIVNILRCADKQWIVELYGFNLSHWLRCGGDNSRRTVDSLRCVAKIDSWVAAQRHPLCKRPTANLSSRRPVLDS